MKPETLASLRSMRPTLAVEAQKYALDYGTRFVSGTMKGFVSLGQPRNLLNAAAATTSLIELTGLLRYQMGRRNNSWCDAESGVRLEELLVACAAKARKACEVADTSPERHALDVVHVLKAEDAFALLTAETASFAAFRLCRMPFGLIERDRPMISMVSSGYPSRGTSLFSMPRAEPAKRTVVCGCFFSK